MRDEPISPILDLPRVDSLLSEAANHNIVTIIAGEYYNLSQIVELYIEQKDYRSIWVELTEMDNIPSVFWKDFLRSISMYKTLTDELAAIGFPDSPVKYQKFLQIFSNKIYGKTPVALIFVDFHLIREKPIADFIMNLAEADLDDLNIILLFSGNEIGLINDYQRDIAHIKNKDLRFTSDEIRDYFTRQGIFLPLKDIKEIHAETGGSPLAIQLIGESVKKYGYVENETLGNTKVMIYNWIDEKVFSEYGFEIQNIFIRLSLLNSFPTDLLQRISNNSWGAFKAELEQNPFCNEYPYTSKYRIDPIFLEFLAEKQKLLKEESIYETYITAADWYRSRDMKFRALTYYDKAGRNDDVWDIIFRGGMERRSKEEAEFLIKLIDDFPPDFSEKNPMAAVVRAALLYNNYELSASKNDAEKIREKWEGEIGDDRRGKILGEVYLLLGLISLAQRTREFTSYFKKAESYLAEGSTFFGNKYKFLDMNNALIYASPAPGEVEMLTEALFEAMPYATRAMHGCGCGYEYLAAAEADYYKGELNRATEYAYKAIYMADEQNQGDIVCGGYFLLVQAGLAKGSYKIVKESLDQLKRQGEQNPEFLDIAGVGEAWVYSVLGFPEKITSLILTDIPPISVGRDKLIKVSSLMWQGNFWEAVALIDVLEGLYKERGFFISLLAVYIFKSICYYYMKKNDESVAALEAAYDLAQGNELYTLFIASGNYMRTLINNAKRTGGHLIPEDWLDSIYSKANTYAKRLSVVAKKYEDESKAYTGLSARERTLIVELSHGLTRYEIADSMGISENTVKSMLKSIYSKLGAINRADAVRIAKNMNII